MRASQYSRFGESSVLETVQLPAPARAKGEVLVENKAASITPLDYRVRKGEFFKYVQRFPKTPGCDFAGVVLETETGSKLKRGDRVFGFTSKGTHASQISVPEAHLASIPDGVSYEEAAAAASASVTAWQALDPDRLKPGQRLLIQAGTGGVGHVAIQLAKNAGAHVITTTSTRNIAFAQELGADEVIDYTSTDFVQQLRDKPVDLVVDMVGGADNGRNRQVVKRNGRFAHVFNCGYIKQGWGANFSSPMLEMRDVMYGLIVGGLHLGPKYSPVIAAPSSSLLERIGNLMATGKLKIHIDRAFPLDQARAAHDHLEHGRPRGKVILTM
ncbi:hypothetical protein WJX74_003886 [Apatococcus lobatus]|uniref:Enoyl reductase (ER) domain-containing protein n=1 Tax=Apatococcus lobatus TaxID=904363 RepID=A0AAW1Q573_9CHLO